MSNINPLISINGVLGASLSPLDRGFFYGDGLFETCRIDSGQLYLWSLHQSRLISGCARLKIPIDIEQLNRYRAALLETALQYGILNGVLKIIITRGEGGRGYAIPADVTPTYCIIIFPDLSTTPSAAPKKNIVLKICRHRLSTNINLAGIKHLNRLDQIVARAEWQDDSFDEGILLDENNFVIEATAHNLFMIKDGRLITPDLSRCGVAGVMRQLILDHLAPTLKLPVEIKNISLPELLQADEIFLCNSVKGISPVSKIIDENNSCAYFVADNVTSELQHALKLFKQSQSRVDEVNSWPE